MILNPLLSLWSEPATRPPASRRWWDWALVAAFVSWAVLEAALRPDVVWRPVALGWAVASSFSLLFRNTHPLATVVAVFVPLGAFSLVTLFSSVGVVGLYSMVFALILPYSLARWADRNDVVAGLAVVLVVATLAVIADYTGVADTIGGYVVLLFPVALGTAMRYRATTRVRTVDQIRLQEREQLARELHDTVAHHVSAIAIQAQAGRALSASGPGAADRALEVIEEAASRTLIEMRTMVGALRTGASADTGPRRGVGDIELLIRESNGLPPVKFERLGDLDGLSMAVDAAVYRIVQEAITNAARHSRGASSITVRVEGRPRAVRLSVSDDGAPVSPSRVEAGFGLVGMRERAILLGGNFHAGPGAERGWVVSAELPREESAG